MVRRRARGEGTIWYSEERDRWVGQITFPNGKKKTKEAVTQSEVKKWLLAQRQAIETNMYLTNESYTVASFMERYFTDVAEHTLAPRTILSYRYLEKNHIRPALGSIKLSQLRVEHLQKLYTEKINAGLSHRTVQYIHQFIHTVLQVALKWGLVVRNVADLANAPSTHRVPAVILTASQAKQLLDLVKETRYYALYLTAISLGLREGEILALDYNVIDWEKRTLRVEKQLQYLPGKGLILKAPKTPGSFRTLPLPEITLNALKKHADEAPQKTGLVFCTAVGTPYNPRNILRHFHSLLKQMRLPMMPFHNLRHTCASFHLTAGTNPKVVQEILGHSNVGITLSIYSHLLPGVQEEAAKKMDGILA